VLPCSNLPAPGKWENITPPGDIGGPVGISIDPFHSGGLYVSMHKGGNGPHFPSDGLYESTDCGATWSPQINTGKNGNIAATGPWTSLVFDPVDEGVIYVAPIYGAGGLWKSTDGGVSWTQLFPDTSEVAKTVDGNHLDAVSMDPHDHRHLVVGTHGNCKAPYGPACEAVTTDAGATWKIVKVPVGGWEEGAGPWIIDATSWVYAGGSGLRLTTDQGSTWSTVTPPGAPYYAGGEHEIHPIVRGADGTYFLSSLAGIIKSNDGRQWSLIPNSGGRAVGLTLGDGNLYAADQWSATLHTAKASDPTKWTELPMPSLPSGFGFPYLDYDEDHHILYGSADMSTWRMVMK
jgi:hypothetical protein